MPDSYCFDEALLRTCPPHAPIDLRLISEEEWMEHLVAHMRGTRHPGDALEHHAWLEVIDPIGNSIRILALKEGYQPLNGMVLLFSGCASDAD